MKSDIEQKILNILYEKRRLSYRELALELALSIPTIRKKTNELIEQSILKSIYGGVEYIFYTSPQDRAVKSIAVEAIKLIQEGDAVYLGPGQTVAAICPYLYKYKELTVFTNSLPVLEKLSTAPNITLFSIGGMYQQSNRAFSLFQNHLVNININKAFISASAIDPDSGIAHRIPANKETIEIIASNARKIVFMGTKEKFDIHGPFVVMPIEEIHTVISTEGLNPLVCKKLQQKNIEVILAKL